MTTCCAFIEELSSDKKRRLFFQQVFFILICSVPLKDKKLMEVKLTELPSWILMRDFTPKGIGGAFQRGQSLLHVCEQKQTAAVS